MILAAFKTALANNDFQGIFDSVQSIIELSDPRGRKAFDMLKDKFKTNPQLLGYAGFFESQFKEKLKKNKK